MDINQIKKLVKLVENSEISEIEIEEENSKIRVSKSSGSESHSNQPMPMPYHYQLPAPPAAPAAPPAADTQAAEKPQTEKEAAPGNGHEIKSPIVGTFYRAPAPDADPYIKVGDKVTPGTVLCIVEAMKLMNEIECDVSGTVTRILTDNGKPVEYNQPLFLIDLD